MGDVNIDLDDGSEIVISGGYPRSITAIEIRHQGMHGRAKLNEVELNMLINALHNHKKNF